MSFAETKNIEIGSAVLSILANGGPIAVSERIGNFCALQQVRNDTRRLHVGFSAGRFQFMAAPYGVVPRNQIEEAAWSALRGQIFWEASEIMLRLLNGESFSSDSVRKTTLTRANFRSDEDWVEVQQAAFSHLSLEKIPEKVEIPNRYSFEEIKCIPQNNAVIGNVEEVAAQIKERFDPNDRLMLWFDFFRHDSERVQRDMAAFMEKVANIVN